jgi:hypothetical protein
MEAYDLRPARLTGCDGIGAAKPRMVLLPPSLGSTVRHKTWHRILPVTVGKLPFLRTVRFHDPDRSVWLERVVIKRGVEKARGLLRRHVPSPVSSGSNPCKPAVIRQQMGHSSHRRIKKYRLNSAQDRFIQRSAAEVRNPRGSSNEFRASLQHLLDSINHLIVLHQSSA